MRLLERRTAATLLCEVRVKTQKTACVKKLAYSTQVLSSGARVTACRTVAHTDIVDEPRGSYGRCPENLSPFSLRRRSRFFLFIAGRPMDTDTLPDSQIEAELDLVHLDKALTRMEKEGRTDTRGYQILKEQETAIRRRFSL